MKRLILGFILLMISSTGFIALNAVTNRAGQRLRAVEAECVAQIQRLAQLEAEKKALAANARSLQLEIQSNQFEPIPEFARLLDSNGQGSATPESWERLRAELGLSWHSSRDWILLSKTALADIEMNAVNEARVVDAACAVLAITPDERRQLNGSLAGIHEEFSAWARMSLKRERATDSTIVRYSIPPNRQLAASLSNNLASAILTTLGRERADMFQRYAKKWRQMDVGELATMTSTLSVSRYERDSEKPQVHYGFDFAVHGEQGSRSISGRVQLNTTYFPGPFKSIFPGGWREVFEREGLELPIGD